jgi:hypothetical protein
MVYISTMHTMHTIPLFILVHYDTLLFSTFQPVEGKGNLSNLLTKQNPDVPLENHCLYRRDFKMPVKEEIHSNVCLDPLTPHCIQSSRVLVPAGTSKSMLSRHGIQAVTRYGRSYQTNKKTQTLQIHLGNL